MAAFFRGDLRAMGRIVARLDDLRRVPSRAAAAVAKDLARMIDQQFSLGVDPYGRAWAQLRPATIARGRHWPPLTDTGAMRDDVVVRPESPSGASFIVPDPGGFHQGGFRTHWSGRFVKPRRILPAGATLPVAWRDVIRRRVAEAFAKGKR